MRVRRAAGPVFLACAFVLLAYGWAQRSSPARAHPQLTDVYQLYRRGPPRLKDNKWKYPKADLPSARIDHPVLEEKPWWELPREEWQAIYDSWPEDRKARVPGGVPGMEEEIARLRARSEKRVAPVMALSEEEMLRYVPPQSPVGGRRNYCPACGKGKLVWVGPVGWNEVRCTSCGVVFPNDKYPADRVHKFKTPSEKDAELRYHRDEGGFNHFFEALTYEPKRLVALRYADMFAKAYYYTGKDAYARRTALILERFAEVFPDWCMTNSEHPLIYVEARSGLHSGGVDTNFNCGRWGWKVEYECAPSYEYAYDLVCESEVFDRLSEERGRDVREHIERYLFYENLAVYYSGGWEVGTWYGRDVLSQVGIVRKSWVLNSAETMHRPRNWAERLLYTRYHYDGTFAGTTSDHAGAAADAARVIAAIQGWSDPPGFKHYLDFPRMEDFDRERHFPLLTRIQRAAETIDYPDGRGCPAVKSARTWVRTARPKNEDRRMKKTTASASDVPSAVLVPPSSLLSPAGRSGILPGWGHAALGAGSGERAVQAHLHFSGDYGGSHRDNLGIMLFAFGREMIPDIGYHDSDMLARWTMHALSHNTVVVDRRGQNGSRRAWGHLLGVMADTQLTDCDLEMYCPGMPGMAVVAASGERAYPGPPRGDVSAETFRRMLVLVTADPERPYVVDIFQVKGGSTHDYVLHGSCDHPMSAAASVALEDDPLALLDGREWPEGERPREWPASWVESYGLLRNVRRAGTEGPWTVTFSYRDRPGMGFRVHMTSLGDEPGGVESELFLAESPSSRRLLGHPGERVETDFLRPSLIARRRGEEGLESLYVAVIEPFIDGAEPATVERLEAEGGEGNPIALRVGFPGAPARTDTLLVFLSDTKGGQGRVQTADGAELEGIVGLVSEIGGIPAAAYLVGGLRRAQSSRTRFEKGDVKLSLGGGAPGSATYEGGIASSLRVPDGGPANVLVTPAELPEGDALRGSCMVLTLGRAINPAANTIKKPFKVGYLIDRVEKKPGGLSGPVSPKQGAGRKLPGGTWVHTLVGDHGLRVGGSGTEEVYCPQRSFRTNPSFVIHGTAHRFVPAPAIEPAGGSVLAPVEIKITCEAEGPEGRTSASSVEPDAQRSGRRGAEVRYTLDGSEPTPDSALYEGPFTLDRPAVVKARAFREGLASAVGWAVFTGALEPARKDAAGLVRGLDYEYWEVIGGPVAEPWDKEPLSRGVTKGLDAGVAARETEFALRFTGYMRAPADGVYEVKITSEGPSRFAIGEKTIARRDLNSQRPLAASGRVALKAGLHPVTLTYVRGGEASRDVEARGLSAECKGPGEIEFFREDGPAETEAAPALAPAVAAPPELTHGAIYRYYEDEWRGWPVFEVYTPVKSGVVESVGLNESRARPFALVIEGYLDLPADGVYTFYLASRDECRAYLDDALFVLSRGWNGQAGSMGLKRGRHALRVEYVKFDRDAARGILNFDIEGPGIARRSLAGGDLLRPPVKVDIEPAGGPITGPVTVKLVPEREDIEGMTLRYTLDGREPTRRSPVYAGPFTVERDVTVKARAFLPEFDGGPVAEAVYTAVPPAPDVYVSDLTPAAQFSTYAKVQKDRSAGRRPISIAGKSYTKGLGAHAYSEVAYELRPEYGRFVAVVGLDDQYRDKLTASVEFVVYVDGEPIARSPVLRPGEAWHVNAPLPEGGRQIKLVIDGGPGGGDFLDLIDWRSRNVWDHADWAEAGFVLK